ncbi:alcohol acetyltransferase-domain-containing protein [Apiospora marii]|uniref:Alcohol acetyltransferase-domain-containing protein n=1 Tax=Apiospora marii TaxID=335849 RepID=A0ABR1R483_9PEZI
MRILAMYLMDQYRGTALSCRYVVPPRLASAESQTALEAAVKAAVVDVIMRHPILQVGMTDVTTKTPSWLQLPSLDLTQHIKWVHIGGDVDFDKTLQERFRAELDARFPDLSIPQPGWTLTLFRQDSAPTMEVMLVWNHPQFDGAGAKVFHEDFLEFLNAGNGATTYERTGLEGDILKLPQAAPMLPIPIERWQKLPVAPTFLAKAAWEDIRPGFLTRDKSLATWCPIRATPYKTQFRTFGLDNEGLKTVLARCREHKTTITALLNGLALIAFASHLDRAAAPAFQCSTCMDHRRNLPPSPPDAPWGPGSDRAICNYVTQLPHRFGTALVARIRSRLAAAGMLGGGGGNKGGGTKDLPAELLDELWTESARNRLETQARIEAGLRNDIVGVFKYVTDWQKTMVDLARKPRQFSWLVTNIGVIKGGRPESDDDDGGQRWSIEHAQFGLSAEIPAAAIEFSPVSVAGRGMCVGVNWADCALDCTLAERIVADMGRWLVQLGTPS